MTPMEVLALAAVGALFVVGFGLIGLGAYLNPRTHQGNGTRRGALRDEHEIREGIR